MSSFIFNSDPRAEECAPNTRPSTPGIVVVVGSVILGFVAVGMIAKSLLPDLQREVRYGDANRVESIVLGDSTEACAIDTSELGFESLNLAIGGSGISTWEPVYDAALENFPNLKTVILSGDPMGMLRDGLGPRRGDYSALLARGARVEDLPGLDSGERIEARIRHESPLRDVLTGPKLSWKQVCRLLGEGGILPTKKSEYSYQVDEGEAKKESYLQMFAGEEHVDANGSALVRMLRKSEKRGVNLVLVRPPVTKEFYETGKNVWEPWAVQIESLVKEHLSDGAVQIMASHDAVQFSEEDFGDPNHLSEQGRHRFTNQLKQLMGDSRMKGNPSGTNFQKNY